MYYFSWPNHVMDSNTLNFGDYWILIASYSAMKKHMYMYMPVLMHLRVKFPQKNVTNTCMSSVGQTT